MKRSKFSLSHYRLLTGNMGELLPIGLIEVLPGDTIQQSTSALVRTMQLLTPVMHPVEVRIHHWFVPHRLTWASGPEQGEGTWEAFITGGADGMDASVFPTMALSAGEAGVGTLADYLGVPTGAAITVSALPIRAYQMIWNQWYRDQDLQAQVPINVGEGPDTETGRTLQKVCWEKDYFTSARPWTQKGASVTLPLGTSAPVLRTASAPAWKAFDAGTQTPAAGGAMSIDSGTSNLERAGGTDISLDPGATGLFANLSGATAATVNALRNAFAIQRYEEARARYGSRYTEYLRYLGVRSSDARLQRPEYLGGGRQTIQFSEVVSTSGNSAITEQSLGELGGHGISALRSNRYRRFFEEHGYIVSLMNVKPRTVYTQGLARTWNRRTKLDFWQKELEFIGQQEILNKEIYAAHATPDGIFGYQDRYDEYRRQESGVSGAFRPSGLDTDWHMGRIFASAPTLNASFVTADPTTRIYGDLTVPPLKIMVNHSIQARRVVSAVGTPRSF